MVNAKRAVLAALADALQAEAHVVRKDPRLVMQQLRNKIWAESPEGSVELQLIEAALARRERRTPWLKLVNRAVPRRGGSPILLSLTGHERRIVAVKWSADGEAIISCDEDGTMIGWSANGHELFRTKLSRGCSALASLPGRQLIAAAQFDHTVLLDCRTGEAAATLDGPSIALAAYPDGRRLVGAGKGGLVVWDVAHRVRAASYDKEGFYRFVACSGDGRHLVTHGEGGIWLLLDAETLGPVAEVPVAGGKLGKAVFATTEGRRRIVLATHRYGSLDDQEAMVSVWEADELVELVAFVAHRTEIREALVCSPDGRRIATADWGGMHGDHTIRIWDLETGEPIGVLHGHQYAVASIDYAPDGRRLVSGSQRTVRVWDMTLLTLEQPVSAHPDEVASAVFSPDGRMAVSGGWNGDLRVWDSMTGAEQASLGVIAPLSLYGDPVRLLGFAPDNERFVSGHADGTLTLWNVHSGRPIVRIDAHSHRVKEVTCSPDGRYVASVGRDGTIGVFDAHSGERLHRLRGPRHQGDFTAAVAFSSDSRMLAIGTEGTIELWEVATGELKKETGGHYGWVSCVALSAGARRVASGGLHDYVLALRETGRTAEIIHETGVSYPSALAFSADDRMLVSGDDDGLLRVWNAETGELVAWLPCRFRVVTCRFSPDGRSIWAADTGGSARRPNLYVLELCDFWSAPLAAPCSTLEPGAG